MYDLSKFPVVSHADLLPPLGRDPERELSQICNDLSSILKAEHPAANFDTTVHVSLDCRYTKSSDLQKLHLSIQDSFKNDEVMKICSPAAILFQILSYIVKNSFVCTISEVQKLYDRNWS